MTDCCPLRTGYSLWNELSTFERVRAHKRECVAASRIVLWVLSAHWIVVLLSSYRRIFADQATDQPSIAVPPSSIPTKCFCRPLFRPQSLQTSLQEGSPMSQANKRHSHPMHLWFARVNSKPKNSETRSLNQNSRSQLNFARTIYQVSPQVP
jgi:hypothetical protein